jgi:hypothetical protein
MLPCSLTPLRRSAAPRGGAVALRDAAILTVYRLRFLPQAGALLSSLLVATPLAAAAPSPAERETARSLMDEGERLYAAGDLRAAMARYQSAHAIMHVPTTGLQLARVQAQLQLLVEARAVAMEVVNLPVAAAEPRVFAEARQNAATLANALEPRVPSINVVVFPNGAAYRLTVDGVTLPPEASSAPYRTDPGMHTVSIAADGYAPQSVQVELAESQTRSVSVKLKPLPLSAAETSQTLEREPQSTGAVSADHDSAGPGRVRGIVGLSVGGAALLLGTVSGVMSLTKTNHLQDSCVDNVCDPAQSSAISSAKTLATVANISIPLGVVGIAYGLYELLTLPRANVPHAQNDTLHLTMTSTGAVLGGSL